MEVTSDIFSDAVPQPLVHHFEQLHHGSIISVDVINERGYKSVPDKKDLVELGFSPSQARAPCGVVQYTVKELRALFGTRQSHSRITAFAFSMRLKSPAERR